MGLIDWVLGKPRDDAKFSAQWAISDPAFAAWWYGTDDAHESVTPYSVMGLSAVIRAVQIICVIATLPLRTYERQGDDRARISSVFDDPYPGDDGLTPFSWVETVLIHLLLWRKAFLWHDARDSRTGLVTAYRPITPDTFTVNRVNGKRVFEYTENGEKKTVGSEQITFIPGPSLDGNDGHPLLQAARAVYSAAISGDKTAQRMLKRGIRIGGIFSPADGEDDWDGTEGDAMLAQIKAQAMGSENAGDIVGLNRKVKLQPWTSSNIESQFDETRARVLMEIEQLFGVPPHLMADTEKQTSWGAGVVEQNMSLARFTLMGWSSRIEQVLSRKLPNGPVEQFVEFDYKGLLQGTPTEEIQLLIAQVEGGILLDDEARQIMNRPPFTPAQRALMALRPVTQPGSPVRVTDQGAAK
jgi:HK97 family phage portal protein